MQLKNTMKKILNTLPEFYFMGMGLFWAIESYFASGAVNYIALLATWLLFLQVIYKNRIIGLIYGLAFGTFSGYMLLATISEFAKFETITSQALQLISAGSVLFGCGLAMAGIMVYKFATAKAKYDESVLTVTY